MLLLCVLCAMLLLIRAALSRDSQWKRLLAVAIAMVSLAIALAPMLISGDPGRMLWSRILAPVLAGCYLLYWGIVSRDRPWIRTSSIVLGIVPLAGLTIAVLMIAGLLTDPA